MQKLIFMSSLPRSGSTLLSRILSQNPKIHASPTSGLIEVLLNTRNHWTTFLEHRAAPNDALHRVLTAITDAYYADVKKPIVLDKSRLHNAYLGLWHHILGYKPKVIVTYRNLPDIIASMEKLHQKTSLKRQPPFEKEFYWQMQHLEGRVGVWTMPEQIIGVAYNRVVDAIQRHSDCLHFVNYEKLTKFPKETLDGIYKFLGEESFEHDFDNVPTINLENDDVNGFEGLHTTRSKVEWTASNAVNVIGPTLTEKWNQWNLDILFPHIS